MPGVTVAPETAAEFVDFFGEGWARRLACFDPLPVLVALLRSPRTAVRLLAPLMRGRKK